MSEYREVPYSGGEYEINKKGLLRYVMARKSNGEGVCRIIYRRNAGAPDEHYMIQLGSNPRVERYTPSELVEATWGDARKRVLPRWASREAAEREASRQRAREAEQRRREELCGYYGARKLQVELDATFKKIHGFNGRYVINEGGVVCKVDEAGVAFALKVDDRGRVKLRRDDGRWLNYSVRKLTEMTHGAAPVELVTELDPIVRVRRRLRARKMLARGLDVHAVARRAKLTPHDVEHIARRMRDVAGGSSERTP